MLFAILLLALISLSPGEDRHYVQNEETGFLESPPLPNQEVEAAPGPIKVAVQMEPEAFKYLQERSRIFMESHQVNVELINEYGKDAYSLFKEQLALHDAPDVMLLDNAWIQEFAVKGYLLPVESYFTGAAAGNSLSILQASSEWNGYVWAVPKEMDPYVFVYKPEMLDKLGFEAVPSSFEAWNKLDKAVKEHAAQTQTKLDLIQADFKDPYAFLTLLHRFGGTLTVKDAGQSAYLSDGDQGAVRYLESIRSGLKDAGQEAGDNALNEVSKGKSVLALVPYSLFSKYSGADLHAETPESPGTSGRLSVFGRSFAVSADTADTKTAGSWITAITEGAEQKGWFEHEGKLPALKSLYDASVGHTIAAWLPDSGGKNTLWTLPAGTNSGEALNMISGQAGTFLSGGISAETFIGQLTADLSP